MPTGEVTIYPRYWDVEQVGWVERPTEVRDGLLAQVVAWTRHSEFRAQAIVDVLSEIVASNPNVTSVEWIRVSKLTVKAYHREEWFFGSRWNWVEVEFPDGTVKRGTLEGSPDWKLNEFPLNANLSPSRPVVVVRRGGGCDMGVSPAGYCGVGSGDVALHVVYSYVGPPPKPAELIVYVRDVEGSPIAGAIVTVYEAGRVVARATTDSAGIAKLVVHEGSFTVVVSALGYKTETVVAKAPGEANVTLTPWKLLPELPTIPKELIALGVAAGAAVGLYLLVKAGTVRAAYEAGRAVGREIRRRVPV